MSSPKLSSQPFYSQVHVPSIRLTLNTQKAQLAACQSSHFLQRRSPLFQRCGFLLLLFICQSVSFTLFLDSFCVTKCSHPYSSSPLRGDGGGEGAHFEEILSQRTSIVNCQLTLLRFYIIMKKTKQLVQIPLYTFKSLCDCTVSIS